MSCIFDCKCDSLKHVKGKYPSRILCRKKNQYSGTSDFWSLYLLYAVILLLQVMILVISGSMCGNSLLPLTLYLYCMVFYTVHLLCQAYHTSVAGYGTIQICLYSRQVYICKYKFLLQFDLTVHISFI